MIFNSIRWRLQLWHGLILVVVLVAFGVTAYQVARDNQLRRIDHELEQRLMTLFRPPPPPEPRGEAESARPGGARGPKRPDWSEFAAWLTQSVANAGATDATQTNGFYYVLWHEDGAVAARSPNGPPAVPAPERAGRFEASFRGDEPGRKEPGGPGGPPSLPRSRNTVREIYRFMPRGECLLAGHFMGPELAAMHRLALWLVIAGAGVLTLGLAGGWWLASRAIAPIDEISATATRIAGGDLSQRISSAETDNELGRLATVLNSTFARLEAAFAQQARFTADASHELRTPLAIILSQTQGALARDRTSAEYREALQACQRAAQRMRNLAESLLTLARLDAGQEPLERKTLNLADVARGCVELVRPLAAERTIEIQCDLPSVPCLGDADRLGQVAMNLLANAIQFNHERGTVRIAARTENGSVALSVTDTGPGIPAEDVPHIFERFYRVDKSRSRAQGRTGLGLSISKAIVEAHGGSIEVSSVPGAGSTFTVKLPAPP